MFKDTGHRNAYFPLLIPQSFLEKERSTSRASPPKWRCDEGRRQGMDEPW